MFSSTRNSVTKETGEEVLPVKRYIALLLAVLMPVLCGCSLLEQEYSRVEPHANRYWEDQGRDIMRAETYQDLVNILMMVVEEHEESGVLRLYLSDADYSSALRMMRLAVAEVREETAIGAYVLSALDYNMEELRNSYYQVALRPVYRRTAEDVAAIRETASSSALYDLIVRAWEQDEERLTVRYSYLAEDPAQLLANIRLLQLELEGISPAPEEPEQPGEGTTEDGTEDNAPEQDVPFPEGHTPWEVKFYPPDSNSGIVEIILAPPKVNLSATATH